MIASSSAGTVGFIATSATRPISPGATSARPRAEIVVKSWDADAVSDPPMPKT